jgi:hypothetical protein
MDELIAAATDKIESKIIEDGHKLDLSTHLFVYKKRN